MSSSVGQAEKLFCRSIVMDHTGHVNPDEVNRYIGLAEEQLDRLRETNRTKRKVIHAFIEAIQNCALHGAKRSVRPTEFKIKRKEDGYILETGNAIDTPEESLLKQRLSRLSGLDGIALRKLFLNGLSATSTSRGAGLGLVQLARLSANKMSYRFTKIDRRHSYFSLRLTLSLD